MQKEQSRDREPGSRGLHHCSLSRTVVLRFILISSLLAAAAVCATLAYVSLQNAEQEVGRQTFESIAASALNGAQATTLRKVQGSEVMATLVSYAVPDPASWPFIQVDGYIPIAQKVATLSSSTTQSLMTIVDPAQAIKWEEHTKQVFVDQGHPETAGFSDFGFGIWENDKESPYEDNRVHDINAETSWGGEAGILTPLMMHNAPGASSLLYNVYSEANRGIHLDSMFACVEENSKTVNDSYPSCAVITDMLELKIRPGPAGLLFQPVYPANEPTKVTGFATTSIHWQEVLNSVVPSYINGLTCVISTDKKSYTYEIKNGIPELVGPGDLHDPHYNKFARSAVLNDFMQSGAKASATYTLTVYPTAVMFNTFTTNSPWAVALAFFGVIILCTCLFFIYDFLMRHQAHQRKTILEMKRRFVRFISHEIRTPLSTVCMGLELLESELQSQRDPGKTKTLEENEKVTEDDVDFWCNVTMDIKENALVSVTILNDLLNYDKLETGTMKLEAEIVSIWDLVSRTVSQLNIQAVNRNIDLRVELKKPTKARSSSDVEAGCCDTALVGLGDDVRLMQVMRNVIANALKFTPPDGTITVAANHVVGGLPDAKALMAEREDGSSVPACAYSRAGSIQIRIKDSGVGMTKEQLAQVFREGVQFDANKLQHGGGSGLGMAIAKGIVEQHHGTIKAESEGSGKGTSFVIELPLYEMPVDEIKETYGDKSVATTNATSEVSSSSSSPIAPFRSRRILVAEDATSSRKMLMRLLDRAGHSCVPAANGREAVMAVADDMAAHEADPNHSPLDTILMDFEMPVQKGPDATREIRDMGFSGTILGVTGNVLSEDVEFFKEHGADEVLPKPISMGLLKEYWEHLSSSAKRSHSFHGSLREESTVSS